MAIILKPHLTEKIKGDKYVFEVDKKANKPEIKKAVEKEHKVDIIKINPKWINGIFNYITTNLLHKGYFDNDKINIPNLLDLLNQALQIVKEKTNNLQDFDSFFSGKIELPNGEKQEIFVELNETNRFTIMLPEDR